VAALRELEQLEREEREVREAATRLSRISVAHERPTFATLGEVEASLAPDEAFLSFQLAPWTDLYGDFGGGSWLLVTTRKETRVIRLPDRAALASRVETFVGLFKNRGAYELAPVTSVRIYSDLMAEALAGLPSGIRRLVVIADGVLHHLPFGALRAAANEPPLAVRYDLTIAPSATLWLRWRRTPRMAAPIPVLALADPESLGQLGSAVATERDAMLAAATTIGRLPHAHREARAVVRHLGRGSRRVESAQASEHFLKGMDLRQFGVLHLAAHAIVDEAHPERSSVLLAPGSDDEDGLLQIREIVELDLDGRLVVLSACRTASGTVLGGEGVLGLARAFFQAGAHAVIGSLWPLRDDDAAGLFDAFYRHLSEGRTVAAAMHEAQAEAFRSGRPAAAWAGVVVLGDGGLTPMPGGRSRLGAWWWLFGAACVAMLLVGWRWSAARRRGAKISVR
jgi:CHAT domain-containing protein